MLLVNTLQDVEGRECIHSPTPTGATNVYHLPGRVLAITLCWKASSLALGSPRWHTRTVGPEVS